MSYRSLKRVLGETNLERKCRVLFGVCLFLLLTASFWWYGSQTEKLVHATNQATGRNLVNTIMLQIHWSKLETDQKFRDVYLPWLTQQLGKVKCREFKFILPERRGNLRETDAELKPENEFEQELLRYYLQFEGPEEGPKEKKEKEGLPRPSRDQLYAERFSEDKRTYFYYQPIYADSSCVTACHQPLLLDIDAGVASDRSRLTALGKSTAQRKGDLMAVIKIGIPNEETLAAMHWNRAILVTTALVTMFFAMLASYAIIRYVIVKPLKHLRDVSDAISRGNITMRAEIRTGDEFEALAVAFNRMLRHLVSTQEELRRVNADLDAKVDALARANMQLYELNRVKSDFLATMSHELRTPLNSILGFSELLSELPILEEKHRRYVQNIQKSGRHLLEMINDILDLAKIEAGRMELRPTDFSIVQVVQAQCDLARPLAEKKHLDLRVQIPADLPPMFQDQARVQQILNNLLSNAIKFTPEGGQITVSIERQEDWLLMRVADTGIGIAEEDQQIIFEKFRQGSTVLRSDSMAREYSGTGLGLSIVKELCRLMGGEVSVQSQLGKGSIFTVRLPWILPKQPPKDQTLADSMFQFVRSGLEMSRDFTTAAASSNLQSAAAETSSALPPGD
ncbi:MAG: ATP-binding protein [Thermoguttaceae bacterium]|nr:ATP-binding protein [Thermoguttaceae bacterium]MDW8038092.1 ATP-binding protein [Thermoguttaceae bacterium]